MRPCVWISACIGVSKSAATCMSSRLDRIISHACISGSSGSPIEIFRSWNCSFDESACTCSSSGSRSTWQGRLDLLEGYCNLDVAGARLYDPFTSTIQLIINILPVQIRLRSRSAITTSRWLRQNGSSSRHSSGREVSNQQWPMQLFCSRAFLIKRAYSTLSYCRHQVRWLPYCGCCSNWSSHAYIATQVILWPNLACRRESPPGMSKINSWCKLRALSFGVQASCPRVNVNFYTASTVQLMVLKILQHTPAWLPKNYFLNAFFWKEASWHDFFDGAALQKLVSAILEKKCSEPCLKSLTCLDDVPSHSHYGLICLLHCIAKRLLTHAQKLQGKHDHMTVARWKLVASYSWTSFLYYPFLAFLVYIRYDPRDPRSAHLCWRSNLDAVLADHTVLWVQETLCKTFLLDWKHYDYRMVFTDTLLSPAIKNDIVNQPRWCDRIWVLNSHPPLILSSLKPHAPINHVSCRPMFSTFCNWALLSA